MNTKGTGRAGEDAAANFLLKKGLAIEATAGAVNELNMAQKSKEFHEETLYQECAANGEKIKGKTVTIKAKAGTGGRLFGSVTSKEIAAAIKEAYGIDVDKRKVALDSDIKAFGAYEIAVKLHTKVTVKMTVSVVEA